MEINYVKSVSHLGKPFTCTSNIFHIGDSCPGFPHWYWLYASVDKRYSRVSHCDHAQRVVIQCPELPSLDFKTLYVVPRGIRYAIYSAIQM